MSQSPFEDLESIVDNEEREELLKQVLELQGQLRGMITKVDKARDEHQSLTKENQLLQKYINNSLTSTAVFGATNGAVNANNMSLRQETTPR
ncbi:hypothetical protein BY458DRAFT_559271 [Sporodiniella umbellata]|nr:hypothetical protein BY458DRAFT_559271 [Sporodiniella umbellata]